MRRTALIIATALLATTLATRLFAAEDDASTPPPVSCGNGVPGGINCIVTKKNLKEAKTAFARGRKLQDEQRLEEAFDQFDTAARLVPQNTQFLTARELVKGQLVFNHVERGNVLLMENSRPQASAEFRKALDLDPYNDFVRERLEESRRDSPLESSPVVPAQLADASEIRLQPSADRATFHFRGDVRSLFTALATAYRLSAQFDDSMQNQMLERQVLFNLDNADFFTAVKLACAVSKTIWTALDTNQFLVATDTPENHKLYDRMWLQTLTLPPHSSPQEATDMVNTLRVMFDVRFAVVGQTANVLEVRAPKPVLDACAKLMEQLNNGRPQVMLDVEVFQISHQFTRDIGIHVPNTFNMFNIPAAALAGLGGVNIQDLINQLISSGGINQAGSSTLAGLLAQLGGQQNSIFSQPLATFGGGLTLMGISLDHLAAALSVNESWARSLEHLTIRAGQGNDATFHLGERYPILNASYAPIFNSPQISQVLGNQTYIPPFPSISYEDLGLNLKAKPVVHSDGSVSLQLEMQLRSLTGQSANGVPVISSREYKGSINLREGEPAVVAGEVSQTDQLSMSGIPGFSAVPGLNQLAGSNSKEADEDELMVIITPHILADVNRMTPEIWISER